MTVVPLQRPVTIGGSTAAAAAGVDPYCSRIMLWLQLTGRVERVETEAMRWGKRLEPLIMAELTERGYVVTPNEGGTMRDGERHWLTGTPDGSVENEDGVRLLEIKTSGRGAGWHDNDVPLSVRAQVQHYLHLTGFERALVACLMQGQRLELRELDRDQHAIDALLELEQDFVGYVQRDEPPAADGSDSSRDALTALYPQSAPGQRYRLSREEWALVRELRARREQQSTIKTQVQELENRLKQAMGDAEAAISPHDTEAIRWRTVVSHRIDTKALRAEHPRIAQRFTSETTARRFTLA